MSLQDMAVCVTASLSLPSSPLLLLGEELGLIVAKWLFQVTWQRGFWISGNAGLSTLAQKGDIRATIVAFPAIIQMAPGNCPSLSTGQMSSLLCYSPLVPVLALLFHVPCTKKTLPLHTTKIPTVGHSLAIC